MAERNWNSLTEMIIHPIKRILMDKMLLKSIPIRLCRRNVQERSLSLL
ncbi:MAG: hypothetical protein ACLUPF_05600 [Dorea sp.]